MANPFNLIKAGVVADITNVDDIEWAEAYNGQSYDQFRSRVARQGAGVFVRVAAAEKLETRQAARSAAWTETLVELLLGVPNLRDRTAHGDAADQIVWDVITALHGDQVNLSWIQPLQFRQFELIDQTENSSIISAEMATAFRVAGWTG